MNKKNILTFLKTQIEKNNKIKKELEGCSDDFLLKNELIILSALDKTNYPDGYEIVIKKVGDNLEWGYIPNSEHTIEMETINSIKKNYLYELPDGWNFYNIDLNDVYWTENKRNFSVIAKKIIDNLDKDKNPKGFWVKGETNSGKTYAAIAFLNTLSKKGYSVSFVNLSEFISKWQLSINDNSYNFESKYVNDIKTCDFLVIDDIGSERPTQWSKENVLLPIIDYRFNSKKTTIFTSSLSINDYLDKLNKRSQDKTEHLINKKIISKISGLVGKNEINF